MKLDFCPDRCVDEIAANVRRVRLVAAVPRLQNAKDDGK